MKRFEEILSNISIDDILKCEIKYEDYLPDCAEEIQNVNIENVLIRKIAMKFIDGTITEKECDECLYEELNEEVKIYKIIFKLQKSDVNFKDIEYEINKDLCLELYFGLTKESDKKEAFEKLLTLIYCNSEGEEKYLRRIAYYAYKDFDDIREYVNNEEKRKKKFKRVIKALSSPKEYRELEEEDMSEIFFR